MKKIFFWLIYFLIGGCVIAASNDCTFRDTKWGDDIEKVKAVEKADFLDQANINNNITRIRYVSNLQNYKTTIVYFFGEDKKLKEASYTFENSVNDSAEYIYAVKSFINLLSKKYGEPINNDNGLLSVTLSWKTSDTAISIHYFKPQINNFINQFFITYESIKEIGNLL